MTAPRSIGFWTAVALVLGNMVGSGVFLLPASLASFGGVSLIGWVISATGALCLAVVFARLARIDPAAGGPYAYTRRAYGDFPAFLVAWGYWISVWSANAALAVAFVGYLDPFLPSLVREPVAAASLAIGAIWLLTGVNILGVALAGRVQLITTLIKALPLALVGIAGLFVFDASHFRLTPPAAGTTWGAHVLATVTLTLWAFLGLECATIPAASVRDPDRTIPRATLLGTALAAAIYVVSTVGVMSAIAPDALASSTAPFAAAAQALFGPGAAALVAIGAAISCFGALNGWILIVGQWPLAVARDGLFPAAFARTSPRGTPVIGMAIGGVLSTLLVASNYAHGLVEIFTFIILLATLSTLLPYAFCSLAVFMPGMAARRAATPSPWRTIAAIGAFVYAIGAVAGAGVEVVYWGFLLQLAGIPIYVWIARGRANAAAATAA
jgi:APA family basic amino acid/polyamine antiporter